MSSSSPTKKRKVPSFSPTVKPHTPKKRHSTAVTEPLSGGLPPAKGISQSPTTSGVKVKQEPALVASVSLDLPKNTPGTSTECPILISDDEISSDDADRSDMEDLYADPDPTRSDSVGSESTGEEGDSEGDAEEQLEERTSKSPSPLVKAEGVAASPPSPSTTHALPSRPILTLQEVMDRPSANQLLESTTSSKTLPSVSPAEPDSCPPGAPSAPAAILSPSPPKPRKRQLEVDSPMIDLKKRRLSAGGEPRHLSQAPRKSPSHIFKAPPHKIASLPSQPPASTSLPPPTQISEESPQLSSSLGRTSSTVLVERMLISDVSYTQKSEKVASISPAVSTTPGPAKDPSPSPASSPSQDSTRSRTSSPSPVPSFVKPPPPSQLPPSLSPTTKKRRMRLQRHPEHWHLDGSVIVKIRSTMFRLHRSRLVQQSPYFDKLFDGEEHGSQRDGEGDEDEVIKKRIYIEHTPVFDVPGVSVTDFEHLLEALDGGIAYVFNLPPFNVIASILRASRTLSFKTLDDFASHTLRQMWPSDLSHLTQSQIAHASETIVLARTCKMPELLKRAFYELARTGSLGQEVVDDSIDEDITCLEDEEDKLKIISRGDLVRLIKLREELHLSWYLAADSYPSALEFSCPLVLPELPEASGQQAQPPSTPVGDVPPIIALEQNVAREKCQAAHEKFASHWDTLVKKSGIFEDCMYDPICGLDRVSKVDWSSCGFCDGCVKGWKVSWEKKREKLWSNMNLWLGLSESGM